MKFQIKSEIIININVGENIRGKIMVMKKILFEILEDKLLKMVNITNDSLIKCNEIIYVTKTVLAKTISTKNDPTKTVPTNTFARNFNKKEVACEIVNLYVLRIYVLRFH